MLFMRMEAFNLNLGELILFVFLLLISMGAFVISYYQSKEKGFLFNNAYIYATKAEREKLNKKPHYKQSAVVFLLIGLMTLINAIEVYAKTGWLMGVVIVIIVILVIYAIGSSICIAKKTDYKSKK